MFIRKDLQIADFSSNTSLNGRSFADNNFWILLFVSLCSSFLFELYSSVQIEAVKDDGITRQLAMQWFDLKKSLFEVKSIVGLWVKSHSVPRIAQ